MRYICFSTSPMRGAYKKTNRSEDKPAVEWLQSKSWLRVIVKYLHPPIVSQNTETLAAASGGVCSLYGWEKASLKHLIMMPVKIHAKYLEMDYRAGT